MAKKPGTRHRSTEQQLADAEERASQLRKKTRERDTRRKILIGSMYQSQADQYGATAQLLQRLDNWLPSGHRDRNLWLDDGIGQIRGLYGAKLSLPTPGWSLKVTLRHTDRYGNPIPITA